MIALVDQGKPFDRHLSGRIEAGFEHEDNDCTVRATAAAWGITYTEAHKFLAALGRKDRKGFHTSHIFSSKRLKRYGTALKSAFWSRRRVFTFLRECNPTKRYMVHILGHVFAVVGGRIQDANFRSEKCIIKTVWECSPKLERPGAINLPVLVSKNNI